MEGTVYGELSYISVGTTPNFWLIQTYRFILKCVLLILTLRNRSLQMVSKEFVSYHHNQKFFTSMRKGFTLPREPMKVINCNFQLPVTLLCKNWHNTTRGRIMHNILVYKITLAGFVMVLKAIFFKSVYTKIQD